MDKGQFMFQTRRGFLAARGDNSKFSCASRERGAAETLADPVERDRTFRTSRSTAPMTVTVIFLVVGRRLQEVVDATLEGALDGRSGGSVAGCDPEAAHFESGAAECHSLISTGYPSACQPSTPPARGMTRVIPSARSCSATRALVASLGQLQYSTTSRSRGISRCLVSRSSAGKRSAPGNFGPAASISGASSWAGLRSTAQLARRPTTRR